MANGGMRCEFETDVLSIFRDEMELKPLQWLTMLLHRQCNKHWQLHGLDCQVSQSCSGDTFGISMFQPMCPKDSLQVVFHIPIGFGGETFQFMRVLTYLPAVHLLCRHFTCSSGPRLGMRKCAV